MCIRDRSRCTSPSSGQAIGNMTGGRSQCPESLSYRPPRPPRIGFCSIPASTPASAPRSHQQD
eukprot:3889352-Alexandrium_andersonii.AAC.1